MPAPPTRHMTSPSLLGGGETSFTGIRVSRRLIFMRPLSILHDCPSRSWPVGGPRPGPRMIGREVLGPKRDGIWREGAWWISFRPAALRALATPVGQGLCRARGKWRPRYITDFLRAKGAPSRQRLRSLDHRRQGARPLPGRAGRAKSSEARYDCAYRVAYPGDRAPRGHQRRQGLHPRHDGPFLLPERARRQGDLAERVAEE